MGYLLKEALKTLCGVNQWSYAVFWKIGCQNPTLLIWEECYHVSLSCSSVAGTSGIESSGYAFEDWEECFVSGAPQNPLADDKVSSLMNKMILGSRVKIVGNGLVGRVAFTGNHLWILSDNYTREAHPPEVQNEVSEQFSSIIKTLAVIPIFTHGVVQFGSSSAITENLTFVNDVKNLLLQVGCVPGALLSDNYMPREPLSNFGVPLFHNESNFSSGSCKVKESLHQPSLLSQTSELNQFPHTSMTKLQTEPEFTFSSLQTVINASNVIKSQDNSSLIHKIPVRNQVLFSNQFNNHGGRGVEVIPPNPEIWLNHQTFFNNIHSGFGEKEPCVANEMSLSKGVITQLATSSGIPLQGGVGDNLLRSLLDPTAYVRMKGKVEDDVTKNNSGFDHLIQNNSFPSQSSRLGSSGDDLFDILGSDFKSKLFADSWNGLVNCGSDINSKKIENNEFTPGYHHDSESNKYSVKGGTDHFLDAVIDKINSGVSCGTTMTNISGFSVSNASSSVNKLEGFDKVQGNLSGLPLSLSKLAGIGSSSYKSEKDDTGRYSQTSSLYGSQVSSWVEQGLPSGKQNSGGKTPDEAGKSHRKRLKSGESPRPRPKDRQMIQDRMKELREIVPNGAKLSIDALLERTIKHMVFLQSVTKHADKLKQSGESKIINKDGGLVLRDEFERGRTWACEVGSQNMVCPIIVEDLSPPRQMLIEMLCEERGLFLEIAGIVRGMGLTILKGIMETQNNKIWAQFVVEADRDVTRMEIFLSLVHLLEQTVNIIPSSCTGIDSNVIPAHQVASIPAIGRPTSLH